MKSEILKELREAVNEWARIHNVALTSVEAKYSGIGSNVHVLVVAKQGFENWRWSERDGSLFDFLYAKVANNSKVFISRLETMTEEEYEKYEEVPA